AETYAMAILWALVAWSQQPARDWQAAIAIFAMAVVLCWPVWLPVPALTAAVIMFARADLPLRTRAIALSGAFAPAVVVMVVHSVTHTASTGILSSGGDTVVPSIRLFGWPFLVLTAVGLAIGVRRHRATLAILVFAAACLAQIAGLTALQRSLHASNPYLAYKTVHLLVYPLLILAAIAVDAAWAALTGMARGAWARVAAWSLPMLLLVALSRT